MKIVVYDVAAEDGGGLFVLKNFYNDIKEKSPEDIEWIMMVSQNILEDTGRIRIMYHPEVKKSWLHRLKFEYLELPNILKRIQPDLVISLQNMPVKGWKGRQFVYLHQSLQYCPKRFSFLKKTERSLAIRQHIICGLMKKSLPQAEHIFVQTKWIKDATINWLKCQNKKVSVVPVSFDPKTVPLQEYNGQTSRTFFYPARAEMYKNHEVIIEACKLLKQEEFNNFKVIFTVEPNDSAYAEELHEKATELPIEFIGGVPYEKMWDYYSKTILLFSSYLETCGLPMLEARVAKSRILASDMPFSREVLDGYENAMYFEYDNSKDLANKMKKILEENEYHLINDDISASQISLMESMLEKI